MLYYGWENLKNDKVLRHEFYQLVLKQMNEIISELKNSTVNITNILMDVLNRYEVEDENDMENFAKLMPSFFRVQIERLYDKNGIFYNSLREKKNSSVKSIFEV